MPVRFLLNGNALEVSEGELDGPHQSLLSLLRARGLTGAKEGCAEGECGACAVALVRDDSAAGPPTFTPVNACLLPVGALHGRAVVSVEGIADPDGSLHPVQQKLAQGGGSQCGYCTPGFVVSLFCEYYRPGRAGYDAEAISGNLCRCTGYRPIIDAAKALFGAPAEPHAATSPACADATKRRLLVLPEASAQPVLPRDYLRPRNLPELFALQAAHPESTLINGGTDLMVEANQRDLRFRRLISLESVAELRELARTEQGLSIGAGLNLNELGEAARELPLLEQLLPMFASRLIRNRASLGGNLATASPIGDAAPVLLALEAELELCSPRGSRRIGLDRFFVGYRKTMLEPREVIARVHVPLPAARMQRFYKVSKRPLDDISSVAGAFALALDARGKIERLRIAYGGLAATPVRAYAVERAALGRALDEATLRGLSAPLSAVGAPIGDQRASARYRAAMRDSLLAKFWSECRAELAP
jgi:xanthine dehydrogenase small subunit